MTYAFDPELAPWLSMLPQMSLTDVQQVRSQMIRMMSEVPPYNPPVPVDVRDTTVPGPDGAPDVPVRIFRPSGEDTVPGLLFIHGGGFVVGTVDTEHDHALQIAAEVGAVVVSVEYRLAPEHPYPAGVEDCYAALTWTAAHADELGIDADRLGVGGESAGGGLAAAVALLARDRGGPALCFQFLGIPELDDRLDTPSMRAFTDTPLWNRPSAEISWDYYLGGPGRRGGDDVSPYAAPARATDLSGLPPAYVTTCEFDPLRDEGLTYAHRLIQAGVGTELHHYPGAFHGSQLVREAGISKRMAADQTAAIRRGLRAGKE
jgi:acetyl esterase/lipase